MSDGITAMHDSYNRYVSLCKEKGIKPFDIDDSRSFRDHKDRILNTKKRNKRELKEIKPVNKKFKFISKEAKEKTKQTLEDVLKEEDVKEPKLGEFEIVFEPGEQVFLIEEGRIIKRSVTQVNAYIKIREEKNTNEILYILNDRPKKQYKADKLFKCIADMPINNDTFKKVVNERIAKKMKLPFGDDEISRSNN